ncbi:MAG: hypothetical protein ACFHXK_12650 [bacterium]
MFAKFVLLGVSILLSVLLAEGLSRLVLNPIDLLQPEMVHDAHLNHKISPGSGGHDANGFRNYSVPASVEIIAIGDSMTYGVAATADDAWPQTLQRISGMKVYNMALGGYGPLHYEYLVRNYAFGFKPRIIVVGLYLGNDFMDAYNLVYSNETWARYRKDAEDSDVDAASLVEFVQDDDKFLGGLRDFLSKQSILYAILTRSFVGDLVRSREKRGGDIKAIITAAEGVTFINVANFVAGLDPSDNRILEGMMLSLGALERIKRVCDDKEIGLVVTIIPTKARVYREEIVAIPELDNRSEIIATLENEDRLRSSIVQKFMENEIEFIDLLPVLQQHARLKNIYPANDGHPNAIGYMAIAEEIYRKIQ